MFLLRSFPGPCKPDDSRGSHASGIAICSSCRDAIHDLKRSFASSLRLSAVCQFCRFVFSNHSPRYPDSRALRKRWKERVSAISSSFMCETYIYTCATSWSYFIVNFTVNRGDKEQSWFFNQGKAIMKKQGRKKRWNKGRYESVGKEDAKNRNTWPFSCACCVI